MARADYLLQVRGNSMSGVGILDGDLLAVHRTAEAPSGQIVVARLEDEVTVKRLQRRGGRVELIAENPNFAPIVVNGPLTIEGLVVGLIRGGTAIRRCRSWTGARRPASADFQLAHPAKAVEPLLLRLPAHRVMAPGGSGAEKSAQAERRRAYCKPTASRAMPSRKAWSSLSAASAAGVLPAGGRR